MILSVLSTFPSDIFQVQSETRFSLPDTVGPVPNLGWQRPLGSMDGLGKLVEGRCDALAVGFEASMIDRLCQWRKGSGWRFNCVGELGIRRA